MAFSPKEFIYKKNLLTKVHLVSLIMGLWELGMINQLLLFFFFFFSFLRKMINQPKKQRSNYLLTQFLRVLICQLHRIPK